MNWNDWRAFCSERELTQEEVGESWSVYKEIIKGAAVQALVRTLPEEYRPHGQHYETDDPAAEAHGMPDFDPQPPEFWEEFLHRLHLGEGAPPSWSNDTRAHIDYLMHLQNNLNESLSEDPEDETDEEIDTELIADAEESYNIFSNSLDEIKIRVQYYRGHADTLEKEVEVMTDAMARAIRGSL